MITSRASFSDCHGMPKKQTCMLVYSSIFHWLPQKAYFECPLLHSLPLPSNANSKLPKQNASSNFCFRASVKRLSAAFWIQVRLPNCNSWLSWAVIRNGSDTYFKLPPLKLQCHYHTAVFGRDGKGRRGREVHKSRECSSQKVGLKPPLQPALQGAQLINVIVYRDFHFFFWA